MNAELEEIKEEIRRIAVDDQKYYYGRFLDDKPKIGVVMFIAERPTYSRDENKWDPNQNFGLSKTDKRFLDILESNNLCSSYITDIIKACAPSGASIDDKDCKHYEILRKELEVIRPRLVVPLGRKAVRKLREIENNIGYLIYDEPVYHPCNLRWPKRALKIERQIEEIKKFLDKEK